MKHLKKFNESNEPNEYDNAILHLRGINHTILQEVLTDLEKELKEEEPDTSKLMAYADDIASISEDEGSHLNMDDTMVDIVYHHIYDIVDKINEKEEEEFFRNNLPPEEGGPTYRDKYVTEFVMYLSKINNDTSYDSEGRQQDINVLINKFKKGESFT